MNTRIFASISALMIALAILAPSASGLAESETLAQPEAMSKAAVEQIEATPKPASGAATYDVVLSTEEIDRILETLPEDLDISRVMLVLRAYGLENKVGYFFGGKSDCIGWDERWGTHNVPGVKDNGMNSDDPFGMDCSGFVRWCFINASCSRSFGAKIGRSTEQQWKNSKEINMNELLPGDLVFAKETGDTDVVNYVGIIVETSAERTRVICCGRRGVKLENLENTNLNIPRRPLLLMDEKLVEFHDHMEKRVGRPAMRDYRYIMEARAEEN